MILSIGAITPRDSRALWRAIAVAPLDQPIELTIWRDGKILTVSPLIREMPRSLADAAADDKAVQDVAAPRYDPGLQLSPLTPATRAKYKLASGLQGVVVTGVAPSSPAADRGLVPGDVIVRAGREGLSKPDDMDARIAAARRQKEQFMLLLVRGPGGQRFVTLPLHPDG